MRLGQLGSRNRRSDCFLSQIVLLVQERHDLEGFRLLIALFASKLSTLVHEPFPSLEILDELTAIRFFGDGYQRPLVALLLEDVERKEIKLFQLWLEEEP